MATVISCKLCGVQIVPDYKVYGAWMDIDSKNDVTRMHCTNGSGEAWHMHEPFEPEPESPSDWRSQMNMLLTVMKVGNADHVAFLASKMFITRNGKPDKAAINQFEAFAPCKIGPEQLSVDEWITAKIAYNGKTFIFGGEDK